MVWRATRERARVVVRGMPLLYRVLYTKQKTQKNKRWQDGFMQLTDQGKCRLLDESRQEIDTDFKKPGALQSGDRLDFERYLVEIDELEACDSGDGYQQDHAQEPARSAHSGVARPGSFSALPARSGGAGEPVRAPAPARRGGLRAGLGRAPLHPRPDQGTRAQPAAPWQNAPPHHLQPSSARFALHPSRPPTAAGDHAQRAQQFQERLYEQRRQPSTGPSLYSFEQELMGQGMDADMPAPCSAQELPRPRVWEEAPGRHDHVSQGQPPRRAAPGGPQRAPARSNAAILALLGVPAEEGAKLGGSSRSTNELSTHEASSQAAARTHVSVFGGGAACPPSSVDGPGAGARRDVSSRMVQGWAAPRSHTFSSVVESAASVPVRRKNQLLDDDDVDIIAAEVQEGTCVPSDNLQGRSYGERIYSSSYSVCESMDVDENREPTPIEVAGGSRSGFLALKDHAPQGYHLGLSCSKRPRLSGPPSFSAPRAFSDAGQGDGRGEGKGRFSDGGWGGGSGSGGGGGGGGGSNGGSGPFLSLREENRVHLAHDREIQARFQAAAAAKKAERERCARPAASGGITLRPASGGIFFPSAADVDKFLPERQMLIPDVLSTPPTYKSTFIGALEEEINYKLRDAAAGLYRALRQSTGAQKGTLIQCRCRPPKTPTCATVKKEGPNQGRPFFSCRNCNFFQWADTVKEGDNKNQQSLADEARVIDFSQPPSLPMLRQRQQPVYACQLITTDRRDFAQIGYRKKAGQADAGTKREVRTCIRMTEEQGKSKVPGCSKDDLWILSTSPFFSEERGATTVIATSAWFGPDSDNNIEMKPLVGSLECLKNRNQIYGLKGPNISSELDMLDVLKDFSAPEVPLMPALLTGGSRVTHAVSQALPLRKTSSMAFDIDGEALNTLVRETTAKYKLNEEQSQVLQDIARVILAPEASPPVILVQGVFGSGKSTLLVAVVLFLLAVFHKADVAPGAQEGRILISAATNVAVDNILLGLLDKGYDEFIRVGCLNRIAKPILTRTLKETVGNEDKVDAESLKDLNDMLSKTRDKVELAQIRAAIAECKAGKMREKKRALATTQVVGVTCASTRQETLQGQKFGFLILDECSQFIEPLSFLPIARFAARVLIGAGDPKQLPPTLMGTETSASSNDLSKTLFTRLANTGVFA